MIKKLNYKKIGVFVGCTLVAVIAITMFVSSLVKTSNLKKTTEYKLEKIGYTENEINVIKDKLNEGQINDILNSEYNIDLTKFLNEKYFIYANLTRYLNYYSEHKDLNVSNVVAIVNVGADSQWYNNVKNTDVSKGELMLVNKFNGLNEGYEPEDLREISATYAYSGNYISESIYDDLTEMLDAAKDAGYTLVVSQGYRSYKDQLDAYKDIENYSSSREADARAARAGHSEYQTGLSMLIEPYNKIIEDVSNNAEHIWLLANAHRYGFILRYPAGTENITGFASEEWRFRYVGREAASTIKSENITFDEYYAYYINK